MIPEERQPEPNQVAHVSLSLTLTLDEPAPTRNTANCVYHSKLDALHGSFESADLADWDTFRAHYDIEVAIEVQDWKDNRAVVQEAREKTKNKLENYRADCHVHDDGEVVERLAF